MIVSDAEILAAVGKAGTASGPVRGFVALVHAAIEDRIKKEVDGPVELGTFTELYPDRSGFKSASDLASWDRQGQYAVEYRGGGPQVLQLRRAPVRKVLGVWEGWYYGAAVSGTAPLLDPANYFVDFEEPPDPLNEDRGLCTSGQLVRPTFYWSSFARSIKVQYEAGFTPQELLTVHPAFRECVLLAAAKVFRTFETMFDQEAGFKGIGPVMNEGMDGLNFSYDAVSVRVVVGQVMAVTPEISERLETYRYYGNKVG